MCPTFTPLFLIISVSVILQSTISKNRSVFFWLPVHTADLHHESWGCSLKCASYCIYCSRCVSAISITHTLFLPHIMLLLLLLGPFSDVFLKNLETQYCTKNTSLSQMPNWLFSLCVCVWMGVKTCSTWSARTLQLVITKDIHFL